MIALVASGLESNNVLFLLASKLESLWNKTSALCGVCKLMQKNGGK